MTIRLNKVKEKLTVFASRIHNLGITEELAPLEIRRIHFINWVAFTTIFTCLVICIPMHTIKPGLASLTVLPICLYAIVLMCNALESYLSAKLLLSIGVSIFPIFFAIVYGDIADIELMLIATPLIGILLFDNLRAQLALLALNVIGFAIAKYTLIYPMPILGEESAIPLRILTGTSVIVLCFYAVLVFKKETTQAEKALAKNEKMLADAQEISLTGSWAYYTETQETIWSEQMYRIYEYTYHEKADMKMIFESTTTKYQAQILEIRDNLLKTGQNASISFPATLKGGKIKWLYARTHPELDNNGRVISYYGTVQDISDRVAYEQVIKESEQFFRSVFERSPIAIAFCDPNGSMTRMNNQFCEMLGYSINELLLEQADDLTHQADLEMEKNAIQNALNQQQNSCAFEKRFLHKNGHIVWTNVAISFIYTNENTLKYLVIKAIDITKKKTAEAQQIKQLKELQRANTELDQFAYIVSHDLKAPLRGISTLASFIEEDLGEDLDEEILENFQLIKGRINRMNGLINGILTYSRVGKKESDICDLNMRELVEDTVELVAREQPIDLKIHQDLPTIYYTRSGIEQIFQNIISNAIKYNDKAICKIDIFYKKVNNQHQFTIKDNGKGINKTYYEKIFRIFQTLQARDEYESTGIGLSIVKKRIEGFGGKIWLDSEVGKYTSFTFTLAAKTRPQKMNCNATLRRIREQT